MNERNPFKPCPYECNNKSESGWCNTTTCINQKYNGTYTFQWIPIYSPTGVEAFGVKETTVYDVRCSNCGSLEDVSFSVFQYCPRCGAKMLLGV